MINIFVFPRGEKLHSFVCARWSMINRPKGLQTMCANAQSRSKALLALCVWHTRKTTKNPWHSWTIFSFIRVRWMLTRHKQIQRNLSLSPRSAGREINCRVAGRLAHADRLQRDYMNAVQSHWLQLVEHGVWIADVAGMVCDATTTDDAGQMDNCGGWTWEKCVWFWFSDAVKQANDALHIIDNQQQFFNLARSRAWEEMDFYQH